MQSKIAKRRGAAERLQRDIVNLENCLASWQANLRGDGHGSKLTRAQLETLLATKRNDLANLARKGL